MPLDHLERSFLQFIKSYTSEDIRDAITYDVDLGELVRQEYGSDPEGEAMLAMARQYANLYDIAHPGKRAQLADLDGSAVRVLAWLKEYRPDIGYEIETYETYRTAGAAGLLMSVSGAVPPVAVQAGHVGLQWLKKNLQSLASLLL